MVSQTWAQLSLSPDHAAAQQLPPLSLHQRQLAQLTEVFRWRALSVEDVWLRERRQSWYGLGMLAVVAAHVAVLWWLLAHNDAPVVPTRSEPITVALITLPAKQEAPAPEVVPIVKQKPVVKPVVKPKDTPVQKPIERPMPVVERIVETTSDQPRFEASTQASPPPMEAPAAASTPVATAAPAASKPVVEEKEEPPKFGVAYLNNPAPEYPRMSRRLGEQGKVMLNVLVSVTGSPETVEILKSSGFERLDEAALNAVKHWRFEPARKGGKAVSAYVHVPMPFSLN